MCKVPSSRTTLIKSDNRIKSYSVALTNLTIGIVVEYTNFMENVGKMSILETH